MLRDALITYAVFHPGLIPSFNLFQLKCLLQILIIVATLDRVFRMMIGSFWHSFDCDWLIINFVVTIG